MIEARTGKSYWRRVALLWGMFGILGLITCAMARKPALGIFGILLMLAPAWLLVRRRFTWVHHLDDTGVTLRSGKHFAWSDLKKVVDVQAVRGGAKGHSHYELVFDRGRALVFDRVLENAEEVLAHIRAQRLSG